ncbi:MAG: hypothetical protein AMXMBFR13_36860 [Phycisphaerae bacterium]
MSVLSDAQRQSFVRDGFLHAPGFFQAEVISAWRRELATLLQRPSEHHRRDLFTCDAPPTGAPLDADNPHRVWRIMDLPLLGETWFKLICEPRIVVAMSELLGPDINFHNGKAILKPPHFRPSNWGWHQDFAYEKHDRPELAAALIYLHDMDASEGATEVLPGSHRSGDWTHSNDADLHSIPDEQIGSEARPVAVKAGDVLFLHVLTVHRAGPNESSTSRCAVINEYKTAAAQDLWGNQLAFAELPLARGGRQRFGLLT